MQPSAHDPSPPNPAGKIAPDADAAPILPPRPLAPSGEAQTWPTDPDADDAATLAFPSAASPTVITEGIAVPGYEILGVLGKGGMGVVYKARQLGLNRVVALKMILHAEHAGPQERQRFKAEAEAVARLQHPHIVQVFEVGEHNGLPFFSLEFCGGGSLADRLDGTPLPPRGAARLVEALARAMQAAHQAGIVHRDLKPANVLLAEDGTPKVTDFGLAKRLDMAGHTETGAVLGSPSYMAPEQAGGKSRDIGPAADVYALGAILYACLTGRAPFRAATVTETLMQVVEEDPLPVRQLQPRTPRDLETICLKCLHKEPGKRYATARELADDLGRLLTGEPIRARPVGRVERGVRWLRRRPTAAALAAVLLLATVGLLGLGFWFSTRLGAARGRLEAEAARAEAARQRAEVVQQRAALNEFFGLVSEVRERRSRPQPGWTWANLDDLARAASLAPAADHLPTLRSEAARTLGSIDVRPLRVVAEKFTADCVAFHPNGRLLALGQAKAGLGVSCSVRLIDLDHKAPPRSLSFTTWWMQDRQHGTVQDGVRSLAFSPDGRWLVAGTRGGRLYCWDLSRPRPQPLSWSAHTIAVDRLLFSPDGSALFSAAKTRSLKRWVRADWEKPNVTPRPGAVWKAPDGIVDLDVHPFDGSLACSTADGKLHFLTADTLQPLRPPLASGFFGIRFDPGGDSIACTAGGRLRFVNLRDGQPLRALHGEDGEEVEEGYLTGLAFSPDSVLLLTASSPTKHVKLWEVAGGRLVADLFVGGGTVKAAFSPDGRTLAVAADARTLLYEIRRLHEQTRVAGQAQPILGCALHPDGRSLACLARSPANARGRDVTVWPLLAEKGRRPAARHSFEETDPASLYSLSFAPTGQLLAHTGAKVITLRDRCGRAAPRSLPGGTEAAVCFAADGRLWGAVGKEVRLWEPASGKVLARWSDPLAAIRGLPNLYSLAAGRHRVVVGGRSGSVYGFRAADVARVTAVPVAAAPVRAVALNAEETLAAAGTDKGQVCLLRLPGGAVVSRAAPHRDCVVAVAFAGTRLLASGSRDRRVKLWGCTGDRLEELLTLRFPRPVRWLAFHPDGLRLFVLLEGEWAVRVWHLDRLGRALVRLRLGEGWPLRE